MKKTLFTSFLGLCLMLASQFSLAMVNINKDDANTLANGLKGVGKTKAEAIIKERKQNGPFKNGEDLAKRVKGIGQSTVDKNKESMRF